MVNAAKGFAKEREDKTKPSGAIQVTLRSCSMAASQDMPFFFRLQKHVINLETCIKDGGMVAWTTHSGLGHATVY